MNITNSYPKCEYQEDSSSEESAKKFLELVANKKIVVVNVSILTFHNVYVRISKIHLNTLFVFSRNL